ncbi:Transthyretin-like family protein [Ancylostoma caninum]|uniref:Transthyretin-like family protein n=1 Tax=Ancylostoma caninum TaxID=29170 RepID=A0A368GC17_ANCCA|nr:Transthyretin-like family protein [Ancylostoma caninum]
MKLLILACLVSAASAIPFIGSVQSVAVTGKLTCNGKPAENVKVKLYEREVLLDSLLDEGFSNKQGTFRLAGSKKELTTIDPKVNIYHRCNYDGLCFKKISIKIPKNFVTEGATPAKTFDIGELNLAGKFSGESTDCLN